MFENRSMFVYQSEKNVRFSENLTCFFFLETPVLRFALLPYYRRNWLLFNQQHYTVHHPFGAYTKITPCGYQGVRNVSFSETLVCGLNG